MECEKIISFTEIVDFSEDDEPPSICESNGFTFAFDCEERQKLIQLLSVYRVCKYPSDFTHRISPKTDLSILKNWGKPIINTIISVGQQKFILKHNERVAILRTLVLGCLFALSPKYLGVKYVLPYQFD